MERVMQRTITEVVTLKWDDGSVTYQVEDPVFGRLNLRRRSDHVLALGATGHNQRWIIADGTAAGHEVPKDHYDPVLVVRVDRER